MSGHKDNAHSALEDYLGHLLEAEPEQKNHTTSVKNHSARLYQLGGRSSQSAEPHSKQLQRVERLLDDYNTRHQSLPTADVADLENLIQPLVLTPEITQKSAEADEDPDDPVVSPAPEVEVSAPDLSQSIQRPEWAQQPFQILLFTVAGLEMAIPLISLGGIQRLNEADVTQLFGKPDWFMGLVPGLDGNINVVDSCRWVMPDRYGEAKSKGLNYSFLILLGDSNWALACSHVQNAKTIDPDEVKWRTEHSKRPWLSGMLIEERCVLLDAEVLTSLLDSNYQR